MNRRCSFWWPWNQNPPAAMKAQATIGPKTNGDERCSAAERASMSLVRVRFRVRASMSLVCRNQRGWLSGSASDRASGCPKPRPASANQPRGGSGQPDWRAGLLLAGHRGPAFDVATRQRKLRSMRPSTWLGLGLESESGSGLGLGLGLGSGSGLGLGSVVRVRVRVSQCGRARGSRARRWCPLHRRWRWRVSRCRA